MSEPAIVCLVILVDSSLLVLSEWNEIVSNYIRALMGRLNEGLRPRAFRLGCVCYASASTRPIPLLSRTPFMGATELSTPLAKNPGRFGIGHTGVNSEGMAVLEGIVAAIELFDAFKESTPNITTPSHIVHIAACDPDSAERPLWNNSPALDTVNWDTLPTELRKRNINYSLISIRASQRLANFHKTVASGSMQSAWFETKPSHTVSLMGFPSAPKQLPVSHPSLATTNQPSNNKRASESAASPESKRPRIPTKASPSIASSTVPKLPEPRVAEPPTHSSAPIQIDKTTPSAPAPQLSTSIEPPSMPISQAPPQSQPHSQPQIPPVLSEAEKHRQVVSMVFTQNKIKQVEERLQLKELEAQAAERAGDLIKASELRRNRDNALQQFEKLKLVLAGTWKQGDAASPVKADPSQSSQPSTQVNESSNPSLAKPGSVAASNAITAALPTGPSHTRTSSQTLPPPSPVPTMLSRTPPQLATQMQKLMDQHNRTPRMSAGSIAPEQTSGMQSGSSKQAQEWNGFLTWRGTDSGTGQRREMRTFVMLIFTVKPENVNTTSWPTVVMLTPSNSTVPQPNILQEWVTNHNGSVAMIQSARLADQKANEDSLRTLIRLLMDKNIFAIAAWAVNGQVKNHLVLFILRDKFCCAYFPDGVPELPKPSVIPQQPASATQTVLQTRLQALYNKLPALQRTQVDALPPAHREEALKTLFASMMRRQQQQNQSQMQAQHNSPGSMSGTLPTPAGGQPTRMNMGNVFPSRPQAVGPSGQQTQSVPMGGAPGLMGFTPQQMAMGGLPFGLHNRTSSGGANPMANVSPGMLQSFMQRNPDPM